MRLRVSSAFKRIAKEKPELVVQFLDDFINKISKINQASTQWTFAQLFLILDKFVSPTQKEAVTKILKQHLLDSSDWIVLNLTMETLLFYSKSNEKLKPWLTVQLQRLTKDPRKSVANRADKYMKQI